MARVVFILSQIETVPSDKRKADQELVCAWKLATDVNFQAFNARIPIQASNRLAIGLPLKVKSA